MPKSADFSLGNLIYILFIGSWVHFGTCDSLFPCFNYFLLEHCDVMCFGLFLSCKMFICNIIELIFFSVPWAKVRLRNFAYYSTSPDCLTNWIYTIMCISKYGNKNYINISQDTLWSKICTFLLNTLIWCVLWWISPIPNRRENRKKKNHKRN